MQKQGVIVVANSALQADGLIVDVKDQIGWNFLEGSVPERQIGLVRTDPSTV